MKRSSLKKTAFAACLTLAVLSAMPVASFAAVPESEPASTSIEPRADEIGYRYRILDGKLQRRLWNYTDGCWIGDWEYC